jgi:hypothetical protein
MLGFILCASTSQAATVCLDEREFSAHLLQVEQDRKELKNLRVAVPLYKTANEARKEELRVTGEYVVSLEHYKELSEELMAAQEQREAEHAKELADVRGWRNVGWVTAGAMTASVIILGILK